MQKKLAILEGAFSLLTILSNFFSYKSIIDLINEKYKAFKLMPFGDNLELSSSFLIRFLFDLYSIKIEEISNKIQIKNGYLYLDIYCK